MTCTFSTEQITALSAPLDRAKVRQREQGRSSVSYLEGRALMTFGNPFGLALYDKQQREVTHAIGNSSAPLPASASNGTRSIHRRPSPATPNANNDPGLTPLDPATTRQILATLRGLPRPVLKGFTKAFRKRFQVPEEATSIADRILQKRHHDWIEAYLVSSDIEN
jgi:hypothetical protein